MHASVGLCIRVNVFMFQLCIRREQLKRDINDLLSEAATKLLLVKRDLDISERQRSILDIYK